MNLKKSEHRDTVIWRIAYRMFSACGEADSWFCCSLCALLPRLSPAPSGYAEAWDSGPAPSLTLGPLGHSISSLWDGKHHTPPHAVRRNFLKLSHPLRFPLDSSVGFVSFSYLAFNLSSADSLGKFPVSPGKQRSQWLRGYRPKCCAQHPGGCGEGDYKADQAITVNKT